MKNNRILALALAACVLLTLAACGGPGAATTDAPPSAAQSRQPDGCPPMPPLTYEAEGETVTVPAEWAINGTLGVSMLYDFVLFTLEGADGEVMTLRAGQGEYLSFSRITDMDADTVLAGLKLQNDIEAEAEAVSVGKDPLPARMLSAEQEGGTVRYYVADCGGFVLLIEQAWRTETVCSAQQAMLDSLFRDGEMGDCLPEES